MGTTFPQATDVVLPPSLVLAAAYFISGAKKAKTQFRTFYKGAPEIAADYERYLSEASKRGWIEKDQLTQRGVDLIQSRCPSSLAEKPLPPQKFLRLFSAACITDTSASKASVKLLTDPHIAVASLVTLDSIHEVPSALEGTPRANLEMRAKAVVAHKIRAAFPGIIVDQSAIGKKELSPLAAAVFNHLMKAPGESDVASAFVSGFEARFNVRVTGAPATWWGPILVAAASATMWPAEHTQVLANDFVAKLQTATRVAAAEATSGWLSIADAYDKFQAVSRASLIEFKKELVEAALDGQVELSPLNVASSLPSQLRERSATEFGGRTYHFLRITKRQSVA